MRIAVVIPALNEADRLAATIAAVRLSPGDRIVVVDGGSTDTTVDVAHAAGAHVVRSAPGRGTQLATGARRVDADAYLFLHADTLVPDHALRLIRRTLAADPTCVGAFALRINAVGRRYRLIERAVARRRLPYGDQALFMTAVTYRALGGFPDQPLLEDVALVRRATSIRVLPLPVLTSARRWARDGVVRTMVVNQICLLGDRLGVSCERLAAFRDRSARLRAAGAGSDAAPPAVEADPQLKSG